MKKDKKTILIEKKTNELMKLLFEYNDDLNQICLTGIVSKKSKYKMNNSFRVSGLCFKRNNFINLKKKKEIIK